MPEKVYNRKDKKGFVTPGDIRWLNGPLKQHLEIDTKQFDFLDKKQITREIEQYKKGDHSNSKFVWRLVALDYWMKNFN